MKYTNKKKLVAMMALLIVAASFSGCNSANTAVTISSEVTSSEIISSVPAVSSEETSSEETSSEIVSSEGTSSEVTSSEEASSVSTSSEVEKLESESTSSEAATSSTAQVSSKTEAPAASSEMTVSSAPAVTSEPPATSRPVSSTASSAPVESVSQTSSAPPTQAVSAPTQQKTGTTKSFEDMTEEELDQWMLEQLERLNNQPIEVHEYGIDGEVGGNSAKSSQLGENVGDVYEAIRLINQERVKAGLNEVEIDDTLMEMANVRAKEMSEVFSHTRPDGTDCWTIFEEFGKRPPFYGGENGGAGKRTAKAQVESWMNSDGHRENILTANATVIGVGYYDSYWAMLLSDS